MWHKLFPPLSFVGGRLLKGCYEDQAKPTEENLSLKNKENIASHKIGESYYEQYTYLSAVLFLFY